MAITEQSAIDKIEVLENGTIQIRRADRVLRDGVEIASTFHRHCLTPGDDLTGQDQRVVDVANAIWTEAVIANYRASMPEMPPAAA